MTAVDEIASLFRLRGHSLYGGEAVTQLEHALQTAWAAENADESAALVCAALVHDIGHLLHDLPDDTPESGIDDRHEIIGRQWLDERFGEEVSEPVRMHVDAKRYLCAVEAEYFEQLSPTSVTSLELQGGPFSKDEIAAFERTPFFEEAVRLRNWDDEAKVVGLETPDLEHFLQHVHKVVKSS